MTADLAYLQSITTIANRLAFDMLGKRDSCILTSFALADVLRTEGFDARPIRVEAKVFPSVGCGVVLGGDGGGSRRKAASPGKWWGHLAVAIGREWLCDATLDQANRPEWSGRVGPLVLPLTPEFWFSDVRGFQRSAYWAGAGIEARYFLYPKQVGFAHAGNARPSHWRPLAASVKRAVDDYDLRVHGNLANESICRAIHAGLLRGVEPVASDAGKSPSLGEYFISGHAKPVGESS